MTKKNQSLIPHHPAAGGRRLLLTGLGALTLGACTGTSAKALSCAVIPEETEGPYPADGSSHMMGGPGGPPPGNPPPHMRDGGRGATPDAARRPPPPGAAQGQGSPDMPPRQLNASGETPNFLARADKLRRNITRSSTGAVAKGMPVRIRLQLVSARGGCTPLAGHAVYIWHCTAGGEYSMYSEGIKKEDFLRGLQTADAQGNILFESIYPGCYDGRWPHIHFEVYRSAAEATSAANKIATSQIALPQDISRKVYAQGGYGDSLSNLARTSLSADNVFGDGHTLQMPTVSGDLRKGFDISLRVGVGV